MSSVNGPMMTNDAWNTGYFCKLAFQLYRGDWSMPGHRVKRDSENGGRPSPPTLVSSLTPQNRLLPQI
ncbi:hypothetical protein OUZ56_021598 [Daphnia magna]|uniref:Uncharacterized protein n=1 Tax=Daphnia magna TaxID=35525 RepID=A0ABR0AU00_9CRUS|nr:hypothetical protein OUZ56_021598 [Daphnia magna]